MTERPAEGLRRTWPQRLLILSSVILASGMFVASARLSSFEQAVSSIVRIEVPAGVLADVYEPEPSDIADDDGGSTGGSSSDNDQDHADRPQPPRNFLLIGTDSAVGLDDDDPAGWRARTPGAALADAAALELLHVRVPAVA